MTDITCQTTTIGVADQSALLSRIAAWCTRFAEGVREGQEIAARYNTLAQLARQGFNRQTIARAALTGF
jgi:TorA maturation chaperone TorD